MVSPGSIFSTIQSGVSATLMGMAYPLASHDPSYTFQEDNIRSVAELTSNVVRDHVFNPKESIQTDLSKLSERGQLTEHPWDDSVTAPVRYDSPQWDYLGLDERVARSKLTNDLKWATQGSELASSVASLLESTLEYEKDRWVPFLTPVAGSMLKRADLSTALPISRSKSERTSRTMGPRHLHGRTGWTRQRRP